MHAAALRVRARQGNEHGLQFAKRPVLRALPLHVSVIASSEAVSGSV